jgi:hypothetical protein
VDGCEYQWAEGGRGGGGRAAGAWGGGVNNAGALVSLVTCIPLTSLAPFEVVSCGQITCQPEMLPPSSAVLITCWPNARCEQMARGEKEVGNSKGASP